MGFTAVHNIKDKTEVIGLQQEYIKAAQVAPSKRQLEWQKNEFYAFCHFGMNTFTGKEWGDGTDSPSKFNPTELDAEQWVKSIKAGGMKALILTCKHHDGFCLWPSRYTDYSVKASPFRDGYGDVVREVSDACRKHSIKFGVYLSPWDRHDERYGRGEEYNEYYKNQLRELLTNYGDIFCVWLDGACGEGKNGKVQEYDWPGYYKVIRELQPNAAICICGPDVRWVGNEAGVGRESEWSVVPSYYAVNEFTQERSQKEDSKKFRKKHNEMVMDLGSRKAIRGAQEFVWYPSETDTSIRPGWFYHENEDYRVKSVDKLMEIYLNSVGNNSALLLNIPPDTRGLICKTDELALDSFARQLKRSFPENLAKGKTAHASSQKDETHAAENVLSDSDDYWECAADDETPEIVIDLGELTQIDSAVLMENIATGQQIESFEISYEKRPGRWKTVARKTVIGYKKIVPFKKSVRTRKIKIKITSYRVKATVLKLELYKSE